MKNLVPALFIILTFFASSGCMTMDKAMQALEGRYYLNKSDYAGGRAAFTEKLAENPDDPAANYYMARFELGDDNPEAALPFILKAVRLAPDKADYRFWEGVTWWALMKPDKEMAAYEQALALDPDHVSANLYLGHNMLDRDRNREALGLYDKVLRLDPENPQAMFNRAVVLERLGREEDMREAMLAYLDLYSAGPLARRGTNMLNRVGDFTWRNHILGLRTVTLRAVEFEPDSATLTREAKASLNVIGFMLTDSPGLNLHVVVYVKGDKTLARDRALAIRSYVSEMYSQVEPARLTPSWFGVPEIIKIDGKSHTRPESVAIFTKVK
jgi:tetratricopeptide (TPR) repeat protein